MNSSVQKNQGPSRVNLAVQARYTVSVGAIRAKFTVYRYAQFNQKLCSQPAGPSRMCSAVHKKAESKNVFDAPSRTDNSTNFTPSLLTTRNQEVTTGESGPYTLYQLELPDEVYSVLV